VVVGNPKKPSAGQVWHVETEPDVLAELILHAGPETTGHPTAYVLQVSEEATREPRQAFCQSIAEMGLVGLSVPLRGVEFPAGPAKLAEAYLGLGRCYAGAVATDLLRVIDHVEHQFSVESEPILLVLSGTGILPGLAFAAIDQRIGSVVVDFSSAPVALLGPTGVPPVFIQQYLHLGSNPLLTLAQCCVPRPMILIGAPPEADRLWLENPKAGILKFTDQITLLKDTYQSAGNPDRLAIHGTDKPKPSIADLVKQALGYYTTA